MSNDWIDVSVTLHEGMVHWPGDAPFTRKLTQAISQGDAANVSEFSGSVHTGTHMDAPRHFIEGAASIDALPLAATVGRARVIQIHDPDVIRRSELEHHKPQKGERLLFKTHNSGRVWTTDIFQEWFVHLVPETAQYLASVGVQTVGIDYLSVGGFKSGGPETHKALLGAGIWIIEGLNLEHIEPGDYDLICLPLKLQGSDGSPARAILRKA